MTPAAEVQMALQSFGDNADDVTISALRTLAFIGLHLDALIDWSGHA